MHAPGGCFPEGGLGMNNSKKRIFGAVAIGALVALIGVAPASATLLVQVTTDTNKDVYQVGEDVGVHFHVYNGGDEAFWYAVGSEHSAGTSLWAFENAAGLSRDELLEERQPIWTDRVYIYDLGTFHPGQSFTDVWYWYLRDALNDPIGPGQYTLLPVDGPDAQYAWDGATVDYSNAIANITIVPEPGTACLLAGLAVAGIVRKNRRARR
jgi:hypothetical protein